MVKKVTFVLFVLALIISGMVYRNHQKNEAAAFGYAKEYVGTHYNERGPLSHVGTRYDFGRGNYFVALQNKAGNRYYLEVKLSDDRSLVSIDDNTAYVENPK